MKWLGIAGLICAGLVTGILISDKVPPVKDRLARELEAILRKANALR